MSTSITNTQQIINENCPACFEAPKERQRVKKMLAREEAENRLLFSSIKRSLLPLMHPDMQDSLEVLAFKVRICSYVPTLLLPGDHIQGVHDRLCAHGLGLSFLSWVAVNIR